MNIKLDNNKALSLIAGVGLLLLAAFTAILWALDDEQVAIFSNVSQETLMEYSAQLENAGIAYQANPLEGTIYVDAAVANSARVAALQESLQASPQVGLELYDNSDLGATEHARKANFIRALQGEIERTLSNFGYVKRARVHLTLPERTLFTKNNEAKASVTLFTVDNYVPRLADFDSIKQLVASAVEHLSPENVAILDGSGDWGVLQSGTRIGDNSILAKRQQTESYLEQKVLNVLRPFFSEDKLAVSVAVEMSTENVITQETRAVKSGNKAGLIQAEKVTEESSVGDASKPGTKHTTREVTYAHGTITREQEELAGKIIRLSAAVSINTTQDESLKTELIQLVKHTLAIDYERGDRVSVSMVNMPNLVSDAARSADDSVALTPLSTTPNTVEQFKQPSNIPYSLLGLGLCMMGALGGGALMYRKKQQQEETLMVAQITQLFDVKEASHEREGV
ncbi:hypothetical protein OE749_11485 [Aestuariibacter sp. AA17]|uniref:Flagellar M-ring protein n=1 Tax=Fluctibacter corallii TaxID=2984329 RepID=A0ABT3A9F7_9ALTE|nr:flagellar M-ring protein FliF C-terminal domain-containing protein [Aestuariibacter sp. AA17]MCV2885315.1 hypothetical protein [Aestuariibacter sp. AA17]